MPSSGVSATERPSRAAVADHARPRLDRWGLADLEAIKHQRINYYLTTVSTVLEKARHLRPGPLSADERAVHRPDLPFAAVQDTVISWSSDNTGRLAETRSELNTSLIYLEPFGPRGGTRAGVRVVADNGSSFTAEELFRKAQAAQARHLRDEMPVAGVGIYRSGLQRGLPAFYLWGSVSRLHEDLAAMPQTARLHLLLRCVRKRHTGMAEGLAR